MVYKNYRVKIVLLYAKMPKITRTNWHCLYLGANVKKYNQCEIKCLADLSGFIGLIIIYIYNILSCIKINQSRW